MFVQVAEGVPSVLIASCVYAATLILLATGFNLTSLSLDAPNFSIGSVMGMGMFATNYLVRSMNVFPYLAMPVGVVVSGVLNWLSLILVFRPLMKRKRGPVLTMVASMGLMLVLTAVYQILNYFLRAGNPWSMSVLFIKEYDFHWAGMPFVFVFSTLVSIGLLFATRYFRTRRFGVVLRALNENLELAQVQGVDSNKVGQVLWVISGGLAGLAGGIHPLFFHSPTSMGSWIMSSVIAASLVGANGAVLGGIKGGILVGFLEIMGTLIGQSVLGPWFGVYRVFFPIIVIVMMLCFMSLEPRKNVQKRLI